MTCQGVKQSTTVNYAPPQLRANLPLRVGDSWTNHGGDSARTEDTKSSVTGTDSISVQGKAYPVYVIETSVTMSGSESGTRSQKWWYSPSLSMPLRIYEAIDASRSGGSYKNTYTATVTALP